VSRPVSLWLVDGFNVLHAHLLRGRDRRDWRGAARRRLVVEQAARLKARGECVWVVFDGRRPPEEPEAAEEAPLRVIFAPHADTWILQQVSAAPAPGEIAVVSADREVKDGARRLGAQVVSPRAWLSHCAGEELSP